MEHLIEIYILANGQTMNPSVLRKKIEEFEKEGMLVKPAVYSILDRAIQKFLRFSLPIKGSKIL